MTLPYKDRREAGRRLGTLLKKKGFDETAVTLGLARGGVSVAHEVAEVLGTPLDVVIVRKLGLPGREELAMGAIASGGVRILNEAMIRSFHVSEEDIARTAAAEQRELERREWLYCQGMDSISLWGRGVILVDDGLATGASMTAAVQAVRTFHPQSITVAVPVGAVNACERLRGLADEVICNAPSKMLGSIDRWYRSFPQVTDEEVVDLLNPSEPTAPEASEMSHLNTGERSLKTHCHLHS